MSTLDDASRQPGCFPVSLPVAHVSVSQTGAVIASFNGEEFPPPEAADCWSRAQFGELLDALTLRRARTIRLEVRESNGSIFTEIIHATRPTRSNSGVSAASSPASDSRLARRSRPPQLLEVSGSGFIPGEDVIVSIPVSSAEGDSAGIARALIDQDQLSDHAAEVLLIGRASGLIVVERLPS